MASAPDVLTAAEPFLSVTPVSGTLGAQLCTPLMGVHSLSSAHTCVNVSLKGEHVTPPHFTLVSMSHVPFICNSCKALTVVGSHTTGIRGRERLGQAGISPGMQL